MGRDQTVINHSLCEKNIKTGLIEGVKSIRKQKVVGRSILRRDF